MSHISQDFEHIYNQVTTDKFLSMQALGGETPFFIYSYDIAKESSVEEEITRLIKRIHLLNKTVLPIDLYALSLEILEERGLLGKIIQKEPSMPKYKLLQTLQNVLDSETKLIPRIQEKVSNSTSDLVFIHGVGHVFPFIRSHTVLNNLQKAIVDRPTLMFFPGAYTGQKLRLFGKLDDDNYYRAFNISNYQLQG